MTKAQYTLDPSLLQPVKSGVAYWTGLLAPKAKNTDPWQIFVSTDKEQNAAAISSSFRPKNGEVEETKVHYVSQQLQDGKKLLRMTEEVAKMDDMPLGDYGVSYVIIGRYMGAARQGAVDGWWQDADTVLPTNEQAADIQGTIRHELGHALGIGYAVEYLDEKGDVYKPASVEEIKKSKTTREAMMRFDPEVTDRDSWNLHLADQNLNPAKPGMEILSAAGFADKTASNELKDVRFGLYGGYSKGHSEGMAYLDYGWLRNRLRRGVMGMTANANYHSRILELGGEYLYDLHAVKNLPWHMRPYVNAQLSRLWQNSYSESGAGIFGQDVKSTHNNYFGAGAGVEFKRYMTNGSFAIRAGVKHAFAGAEPKLRYGYLGDAVNTYNMRNVQDKTHFVLSMGGEAEVARGWTVGGDAVFQRGRHDKDWSCGITVKRTW